MDYGIILNGHELRVLKLLLCKEITSINLDIQMHERIGMQTEDERRVKAILQAIDDKIVLK